QHGALDSVPAFPRRLQTLHDSYDPYVIVAVYVHGLPHHFVQRSVGKKSSGGFPADNPRRGPAGTAESVPADIRCREILAGNELEAIRVDAMLVRKVDRYPCALDVLPRLRRNAG